MEKPNNKAFCILPFIHLYLEPGGKMKPCCIAGDFDDPIDLNKVSIDSAFNSEQMRGLRKDMLEGTRNKVCDICYKQEDVNGGHSPRVDVFNTNMLWTMPEVNEDYSVETEFQHIDLRLSNLCNFKCRMCNHTFSSHWYEDTKIVKPWAVEGLPKVFKTPESVIEELKKRITKVKSIYFAGGEPLIMPEHFQIIKYIYDTVPAQTNSLRRRISLHYNTNLSVLKFDEKDLIEIWHGFERVFLSISCDGIGKVGEYQRTGFKHDTFIKNLNIVKQNFFEGHSRGVSDGMWYNFQHTTTIFNVYHIFEFIDFMLENKFITTTDTIDFYYSFAPNYTALHSLSDSEKERVVNFLTEGMNKPHISEKTRNEILNIITYTNKERDIVHVKESFHYVDTLDKINNTNIMDLNGIDFNQMKEEFKELL